MNIVTKKLIKSLALGAFAIGGGITTLASTSCGADFAPKGDFTISYSGNPYLGELKDGETLVSSGVISFSNTPKELPGYEGPQIAVGVVCMLGNNLWSGSPILSNFDPIHIKLCYDSEEEEHIPEITFCCFLMVVALYTPSDKTNSGEIGFYSNQLAFYFDWKNKESNN